MVKFKEAKYFNLKSELTVTFPSNVLGFDKSSCKLVLHNTDWYVHCKHCWQCCWHSLRVSCMTLNTCQSTRFINRSPTERFLSVTVTTSFRIDLGQFSVALQATNSNSLPLRKLPSGCNFSHCSHPPGNLIYALPTVAVSSCLWWGANSSCNSQKDSSQETELLHKRPSLTDGSFTEPSTKVLLSV